MTWQCFNAIDYYWNNVSNLSSIILFKIKIKFKTDIDQYKSVC